MADQNTIDVGMSEVDGVEVQTLVIDERFDPKVQDAEAIAIKEMQKEFVQSYINKPESVETKDWLKAQMASKLPDTPPEQINAYADEITSTLETIEQKKAKLEAANNNGRPVESWFYNELRSANSNLSAQEAGKYLQGLDDAIKQANDELADTILTNSGQINQNPNLDGFIAEQHHVNTFNLEAEATGSEYRARVLKPGDSGYRANSVDIVVENKNTGKVASRYQVKYGKDAKATADAFEKGDYRGQQKLVPEGQEGDIGKKATTTLEAPDGTKSKPLSKQDAKRMQEEAHGGKKLEYDYNDYKLKDLSYGIAKEAGKAALLGAAVGTGFHVAKKLWDGEKINGEELVKKALQSGADAGAKAATAGALKVLAERGALTILPKGTSACAITAIASLAVDNVKVFAQAANGQMSAKEAFYTMEQNTVATIAGTVVSVEGAAIGATIGLVLGPVGSFVGGLVGGYIGFMAGSTLGRAVTKAVQQVHEVALSYVSTAVNAAAKTATAIGNAVVNGIKNFAGAFFS
ncbi:MAG: hypothetical protein SOV16_00015 [Anaerobiospirillum succiniciproducens]|uniref:hypothetical protein n=1 Tax=Anaerobiospirillum succiniciproducens TaxID=13335 RepID=UPI002A751BA9|nr:hypothetical protein [Anaerobiospirillum succiniciproducens]MDY2797570.1 hypothetical protein [Anaerobiospirillum succiniciproducens]